MTGTATTPTHNRLHGGHCATDSRYAVVGYDVIRTSHDGRGNLTIEVTAVTDGADSYMQALTAAKAHRGEGSGVFGYPAARYACGCRWIAVNLGNPTTTFIDLA